MKVGDVIQIKGRLGFLLNPQVAILEIKGGLVRIIDVNRIGDKEGILSHLNESWHSVELLEKQIAHENHNMEQR